MSRPRIAVLNAAHDDAHTPRNFRRELDADLAEFDANASELPPSAEPFDGVVVTGSRSSVYWDEQWIEPTKAWVREAAEAGIPCLGVCWGHQLLAEALGGEVAAMGEYEIGYREISHGGDSVLFDGIDERFTAFTTHSDEVAAVPPGADVLAENDYSIHAFRKDRAFGVQFHPEYDPETARDVTLGKDLPDERIQRVLDGITEENYAAACEAKIVFENWLEFVEDVRASADADSSAGSAGSAGAD
ncbi:GMP synthase (glutamine-hydrolysing) [Natronoarchaeum philippinense]|uniref:GMP synthase (Glutamine-hydrolysing) n=1 Tax=Natronoarchaeum philippinense TaxID=558529 RepID=A0A285NRP2_NATPI|nr:type 1 glutamine amidotransferase [Natronoarchaeum philippinense]SNZ12155.1 GMP synthase (glutamine-hydrolysing) [Natronoarchaeum philippinense]